jgi:hypothetical protein
VLDKCATIVRQIYACTIFAELMLSMTLFNVDFSVRVALAVKFPVLFQNYIKLVFENTC